MDKSIASILTTLFKKWGIDYAFGIPGKPLVPLLAEFQKQEMRFILSRHESGAGFAAAGYSLINNQLGVAVGTSGPGGTNLLTAAGQAKAYHAPVLFITGHPSSRQTGKPLGQDSSIFGTDLVKMFESVTLFSAKVETSAQFELMLKHAVDHACSGRKGPVHLSIPMEVLLEKIPPFSFDLPAERPETISARLPSVIERLNNSEHAVLFVGKGVHISKAYKQVQWLAESWNIPVVTTPGGKGAFPTEHPLSLGAFGLGGNASARDFIAAGVDEMIVIGSKLTDMSLAGFSESMHPSHMIHLDIDAQFMEKSLPLPTLKILGDAKANISEMKRLIEQSNIKVIPQPHYGSTKPETKGPDAIYANNKITAEQAVKLIRSHLPNDAVLFGDDGSHTFHAIKHFAIYEPGTFFFDDVFGTMGHAIGYSIGAKLAQPDKTIACLTGDGCMFMHGTEIAAAVDEKLPIIYIVLNNYSLDMVDKGMDKMLGFTVGSSYQQGLDVQAFGESLGALSFKCRDEVDIAQAFAQALDNRMGPSVIEIVVDPKEIPPILDRV
ncbi:thiamine pyrophosphate-binding protein [Sediminibacillus albus]|uniref:Acetolactate synthase-1/2/3 large subunit n=1 Tax=Sediminibacillus albus TaxID=407036 RepID=A0A1G8VU87_9BACI|nr:thiamine pyrophosphate-binding protein [Sediminibacillus albus]SDJ69015.1 acetolactate synthase-1/2/3 large subunit [Sediminibacillus albus]